MNDLSIVEPAPFASSAALILNPSALNALVSFADFMAKAAVTVPDHLKGKPADCLAIAMQAAQWGMNPFAVAQKTHIVSGKLGYEAQLVNAVLQSSGEVSGIPSYEYRGDGNSLECRVGFVPRGGTEIVWNEFLKISDVVVKNSPLWKTNPKQQLGYLQVKNWARAFCPGAILGIYTDDELSDATPQVRDMGAVETVSGPRRKSEAIAQQAAPAQPATDADPAAPAEAVPPPQTAASGAAGISGNQVAYLRKKLQSASISEQSICDRFQVTSIELISADQFDEIKAELLRLS